MMNGDTPYDDTSDKTNSDDALPYDDAVPYIDYDELLARSRAEFGGGQTPRPSDGGYGIPAYPIYERVSRRRFSFRVAGIIGATIVLLTGIFFFSARLAPLPTGVSAPLGFRYASCPFHPGSGIKEGQDVKCGFLTVPEDHASTGGSSIQLAVAIYKAPHSGAQADPDPIVYLQGGPGGELLADWGPYITSANLGRLTLGHDLILLDQRGTGYSKPFLGCHEIDDAAKTAQKTQVSNRALYDLFTNAVNSCRERLTGAGVNLQTYTTIQNADDVHDLIHALGYKQVDLDGASYGTRLELTVMRLFPGDIRSVVLDSVVPTQGNLFKDMGADTQHAFDTLFQGCAASSTCDNAYPHLADRFYQLVDNLNAHPAKIDIPHQPSKQLNGDDLVDWLYHAMYETELIPQLPKTIMQASAGDYTLLAQDADLTARVSQSISTGMYYSVECGEDMDALTEQDVMDAANSMNIALHDYILGSLATEFEVCRIWQQDQVPAVQKQPVISTIPTLVLEGEYDPITPPDNGRLVARTLSKSYFFQFPATGHGVLDTNKCPDAIATAFLNNPAARPDASCIATMQEPNFQ